MKRTNEKTGIHIPEVMLPAKGTDLEKWSVIACDQYTSQPDYWDEVKKIVNGKPSTLDLIFPEIYLKNEDKDKRINDINATMKNFLERNILVPQKPGFILVERITNRSGSRKGLVIAVDLEKYDYGKDAQTLIRATEGTVLGRLPPRVKIREHARIEIPHILLLIDDPGKTVIEQLFEHIENYEKLYDFELMQNGGRLKGWKIENEESIKNIFLAFEALADPSAFNEKYGISPDKGILLFAAGDGNHSLAAAKAHWENIKSAQHINAASDHPARFALVEVVNVHSDGIKFKPIHRVLFGIDPKTIFDELETPYFQLFESKTDMKSAYDKINSDKSHIIPFILEGTYGLLTIVNPKYNLAVGTIQSLLDKLSEKRKDMEIDYIHGEEVVTGLGSKKGSMGFYLPAMDKNDLFKTVLLEGVLPRKTFSMGEAEEKRYYLECRKIR